MPKILNPTISCTIVYTLPPLYNWDRSTNKVRSAKDAQVLPGPSDDTQADVEALRRRLYSPSEVYYAVVLPVIQQTRTGLSVADGHSRLQGSGIEISLRAFNHLLVKVGAAGEIPPWSQVRNGYLMAAFQTWAQNSSNNGKADLTDSQC